MTYTIDINEIDNILYHYGTPRHSGRYPWGSGDDPQRNKHFLTYVKELKDKGVSEADIAKGMKLTTLQLRAKHSIAVGEQRKADAAEAWRLKEKGYSNTAIGERMGKNESSIRSLLNPSLSERSELTANTANRLKDEIKEKTYLDVGTGVERYIGVTRTKLNTAIEMLKEEGYTTHTIYVDQLGTGKKTTMKVLAPPNTDFKTVYKNRYDIKSIESHTNDGGRTFLGLEPIKSVNSDRIYIRYREKDPSGQNGMDKDGVIELRRGIPDLSLGKSSYAQVRVGVDDTHFLKGMAMYGDDKDIPDGYDIVYNTNKPLGTPKEKVFKPMKTDKDGNIDKDNPFGATIKAGGQIHYNDKNGNDQLSPLNIVNEEGDWSTWSKSISSQVLSKQKTSTAKKQLGLAYDIHKEEYDEIMSLTNPIIKRKLLEAFADGCDSSAVHLKAAALPRQASHVILPFPNMKENEVYAPNYRDGETVVLIRYPHGGIFEIPELKVNNKNQEAKSKLPQAKDAIGIHPKVAERLSGADFDGDSVLVIPNNQGDIKTSSRLKALIDFDPKLAYPAYEGMPKIKPRTKQMKMGDVSNLITDMTIKGATTDEIARAVRHSMVVIDSEKHNLNYKQSYIDNGIGELKKKYQGSERSGASTLVSRASSEKRIAQTYKDAEGNIKIKTYTDSKGNVKDKTISSTKMAQVTDAFDLSSGTPIETVYANHANKLKALANNSRKEMFSLKPIPYSPSAKAAYSKEVSSLQAALNKALKNAPLERQAQLLANSIVSMKRQANPDIDADGIKKIKGQALAEARVRTGANKQRIDISPKEWEAIQAGAITTNTLNQIINNTDLDKLKQLAMPRTSIGLSNGKKAKVKAMLELGYSQADVADALGVSTSLISDFRKEIDSNGSNK
jgi:DNA-binding CsgD family transcriptional regulator